MHKAKAVVISCMDFRFQESLKNYLEDKGLIGESDRIIIAGASRDFVCPVNEQFKNYVWTQLDLSLKLHDPEIVMVVDHQDCGGYAQDGTIAKGISVDEDRKAHEHYLAELKQEFNNKYPQKEIRFFYMPLDGGVEVINL